ITGSGPFTVDASIFGHSTQRILTGLPVSDQGTSNFVSEIYGQVYTDANGNGTFDAGDTPAAGQTVFLDQNGDGVPDDDTYTADPDGLSNGTALTNLYPELTLSTSNPNPVFDDASVQAQNIAPGSGAQPTTGSAVFGWGPGFNFWTNNTRLRGDFYRPADSVSIDFVATTISASIGRLDVYSADGTLLQTVTTAGLVSPASATLTITRPQADIAYFVAYPDASGFPFNYFDNLRYSIPEQTTTTDASGNYSFGLLQDGTYTVRTVGQQRTATIAGLVPARHVDFPTTGTGGGGGGGGGTTTGGTGRTVAIGGGPGSISLYSAGDGQLNSTGLSNFPILFQGAPFDGTYRTATGDVNGDGIEDTVVVTGPGVPVQFAVIDGKTNSLLVPPTTAFAGSNDFTGGGFVSVGDLDGDGKAEIVLTPDQGGGPRVTIFSVTPVGVRLRANFFGIDDPNFRGGARTAVGDLNGDGHADLAVAAGFAGGPRVSVYDGRFVLSGLLSRLTSDFFAFDPSLRNGVYLSIGDVNGDGFGDLVIGAGSGGAPEVRVLSGKTLITGGGPPSALAAPLADFFVKGDTTSRGGVRVATKDVDGDGKADVIVGSGEDVPSYVRVYSGSTLNGSGEPAPLQTLDPFGGVVLSEGVFVG
ncbi:MAG TPA: FG-GAP-like repeat-containing protein, partial [Urbifossiella sp.]|nr:FG-GAP-like repeat-containing protein [Urbifossiella sp.]